MRSKLILIMIMFLMFISVPVFAQSTGAKKINLDAANIKKATEILNRNKQFFSDPENVKTFTKLVNTMNKPKSIVEQTKVSGENNIETKIMEDVNNQIGDSKTDYFER